MSYMKEAWSDLNDELDAPEPMRPIRLRYVTLASEKQLLVDTCERLGLVCVEIGRTFYALNETDSLLITQRARDELARAGIKKPNEAQLSIRIELILLGVMIEQGIAPELVAQQLRAEGDEILAKRGVEIKARVAHRISEIEAA